MRSNYIDKPENCPEHRFLQPPVDYVNLSGLTCVWEDQEKVLQNKLAAKV